MLIFQTFSQILFYDGEYELQRRTEICKRGELHVSNELLQRLREESHRCNQFYKQYKAVGTQIIEQPDQVDDFRKLKIKRAEQKPYELPSANDLAVLIPANSNQKYSRDIIVQKNGNHLMIISSYSAVISFALCICPFVSSAPLGLLFLQRDQTETTKLLMFQEII